MKKGFPFITIIFPNWNGKDNTLHLLDSLEKLNYPKYKMEIICIDNGSNDGSQQAIKDKLNNMSDEWSSKKCIKFNKNQGAVKAYNEGFNQASPNMDFLWKLDNDIILDKDSLKKLLEKFKTYSKVGVVGSIVFPLISYDNIEKNLEGKGEVGCKINFITTNITKKLISYSDLNKLKNSIYSDISYSIGCSNLIKKDVLKSIGFLDNDFFLYYDDSYFAYCAKKSGFGLLTATDSIVYHKGSASTGGIMKPLGIYYTTLSENIFFLKTLKKPIFFIYYPLIFIKRLFLTILRLLKSKSLGVLWEGIKMFLLANKNFITHNWN